MNDWQDRIVDSALHELGGRTPPDLSARIVIALSEASSTSQLGDLPMLQETRRRWLPSILLAAACLCIGLLAAYVTRYAFDESPSMDVRAERVALRVHAGEVAFVFAEVPSAAAPKSLLQPLVLRAGDGAMVPVHCGARLLAAEHSRLRLGVFPMLEVAPATELEVRSMEFSMKNGVVAATSLTIGVVAGMVTWNALASPGVAASGEVVHLQAEGTEGKDYVAENARLLQRLSALEQENARLMTMREGVAAAAVVEEPVAPEVLETPEPATAAMFDDPKYADMLSQVDWALMGKTTLEMQPLMNELVRSLEETGEVSPEVAVALEKLNANLLAQLPTIMKAGLPGTGANGAYTHPLVVANTLATTLQAAGQPLDGAQSAALAGLVRSFTAELDSVAGGQYEFEAETVMHEVDAKDRFYAEMSQRLTPEQFAAIYPKGSTEFDGVSLFGSGLMTRFLVNPVDASNAAEFARSAGNRLGDKLHFSDADTVKLRGLIETIAGQNAKLWGQPASVAESKLRFLRAGRTKTAMANQVAMLRAISRQFSLSPEQKQALAEMSGVLVPLHQ
jgi:hypothetical protein